MANEFKHKSVGTELTQAEFEAVNLHEADGQLDGDLIYYDSVSGTWKRKARIGKSNLEWTANRLLKGAGAGADPTEISGWEKIAETVLTSAVTNVDFTGLNINTDRFYVLFLAIKFVADPAIMRIFVEGDYTLTNYYAQWLTASGTSVTAGRLNEPHIFDLVAGESFLATVTITRDPDGIFRYTSLPSARAASSVSFVTIAGAKTASVTNITSIRISTSGDMAVGSILMLCKPRTA